MKTAEMLRDYLAGITPRQPAALEEPTDKPQRFVIDGKAIPSTLEAIRPKVHIRAMER